MKPTDDCFVTHHLRPTPFSSASTWTDGKKEAAGRDQEVEVEIAKEVHGDLRNEEGIRE